MNAEVVESDKIANRKIRLASKDYFCKTSGTRLLDQNGSVLSQEPRIFILTTADVGTFEELKQESVYSIAFADSDACTAIFKK